MLGLIWAFLGTGVGRIVGGVLAGAVVMIGLNVWSSITEWRVARAYQRGAGVVIAAVKKRDAMVASLEQDAARDAAVIEGLRQKIEGANHEEDDVEGSVRGAPVEWSGDLDRVLDAAGVPR